MQIIHPTIKDTEYLCYIKMVTKKKKKRKQVGKNLFGVPA